MEHVRKHYVAVIGGAVAGAEASYQLAQQGYKVVVFDQLNLPYGKIEDGLPKWHHKLREKEISKIDEKILHNNIRFIPQVKIGRDISFDQLINEWGFSAIIFATGAWKDRPLGIKNIDNYINKGLVYQNPLLFWFNHYHESDYNGRMYNIEEGTAVIGGGLASLDVMKIVMMETVMHALIKKGIGVSMYDMEKDGVLKTLEKHNLSVEKLGVKKSTLFYRRRVVDMPLVPRPRDTEKQKADAERISKKLVDKYTEKFQFNIEELCVLKDFETKYDNISSVIFQKMKIEDGKLVNDGDKEVKFDTTFVISSIGSIPDLIPGMPNNGTSMAIENKETSRVKGYTNLFGIGNAVTGRGNINESLKHSKGITQNIIESHLNEDPDNATRNTTVLTDKLRQVENRVDKKISTIVEEIECQAPQSEELIKLIASKVKQLQQKAGFDGDYYAWKEKFKKNRLAQ